MRRFALLVLVWTVCCAAAAVPPADRVLKVGSKRFTESYILGEILAQTAAPVTRVEHRQGLGNTAIVLSALRTGAIDVYPEYLGTIDLEILKNPKPTSLEAMREALRPLGLGVGVPLGFSNGYALATRGDAGITTLSGLASKPAFKLGLSHEFLGRADGWPGLASYYGLPQQPRGIDHGIAYEALKQHQVDVIDIYSTDAKIRQYGLRVLDDDKHYFPRYDAVLLYRLDLPQRLPQAWRALQGLEGKIASDAMIAMNAEAELEGKPFAAIAGGWLAREGGQPTTPARTPAARDGLLAKTFGNGFTQLARQHLMLVLAAVLLGCLAGIPLGVLAASRPGSWLDRGLMTLSSLGVAVPNFWLAMILVSMLALERNWFPATGSVSLSENPVEALRHALLPGLALAAGGVAEVARQLRSSLAELLSSQQVRTLHAKGVSPSAILWKHGLKNVGVNLLTVIALLANRLLAATVVVEAVFAIPGMGSLIVHGAVHRDFPVVQGVVFTMVLIVILINFTADALYRVVDPRVSS